MSESLYKSAYRDCSLTELNISFVGSEFNVCGFVQKVRDLGQLVFVDLRDRSGILQICVEEDNKEAFELAKTLHAEYVISVFGVLREREAKNKELATGDVELVAKKITILSKANTPPYEVQNAEKVNDELRLTYRYLDLRRAELQHNFFVRHNVIRYTTEFFSDLGFYNIETPCLIKSTPEGARDYLVPSRVFPNEFFALPQSPQVYKQILMMSGFERYYQIARCFRDEDLRADRQPEFTQIDLEMSYVNEEDVMKVGESFLSYIYKKVLDINLPEAKRMTYSEAMQNYGSDKPDLRFDMKIVDVTEILKNTEFKVFSESIKNNGLVVAINAKNQASTLTRKEIDKLIEETKSKTKALGVAFSRYNEEQISSSFEKFLSEEEVKALHQKLDFCNGDVIMFISLPNKIDTLNAMGTLRLLVANKCNLIEKDKNTLLWVTDFPMFEQNDDGSISAMHHPFTAPNSDDLDKIKNEPLSINAKAYDLVLNGVEIGGGSVRIHDNMMQKTIFDALNIDEKEANERFSFLLEALKYGVPPHAGMAFGLDRLVMALCNTDSIRDVIAFPKVQSSADLMSGSPSFVAKEQLDELNIKLCEN